MRTMRQRKCPSVRQSVASLTSKKGQRRGQPKIDNFNRISGGSYRNVESTSWEPNKFYLRCDMEPCKSRIGQVSSTSNGPEPNQITCNNNKKTNNDVSSSDFFITSTPKDFWQAPTSTTTEGAAVSFQQTSNNDAYDLFTESLNARSGIFSLIYHESNRNRSSGGCNSSGELSAIDSNGCQFQAMENLFTLERYPNFFSQCSHETTQPAAYCRYFGAAAETQLPPSTLWNRSYSYATYPYMEQQREQQKQQQQQQQSSWYSQSCFQYNLREINSTSRFRRDGSGQFIAPPPAVPPSDSHQSRIPGNCRYRPPYHISLLEPELSFSRNSRQVPLVRNRRKILPPVYVKEFIYNPSRSPDLRALFPNDPDCQAPFKRSNADDDDDDAKSSPDNSVSTTTCYQKPIDNEIGSTTDDFEPALPTQSSVNCLKDDSEIQNTKSIFDVISNVDIHEMTNEMILSDLSLWPAYVEKNSENDD